jgi:hypothetical protein
MPIADLRVVATPVPEGSSRVLCARLTDLYGAPMTRERIWYLRLLLVDVRSGQRLAWEEDVFSATRRGELDVDGNLEVSLLPADAVVVPGSGRTQPRRATLVMRYDGPASPMKADHAEVEYDVLDLGLAEA